MENNLTIEGNKAIDIFMDKSTEADLSTPSEYLNDLKYHSSWDWIMPVVEKIEWLWNPYNPNCIYDELEFSQFEINSGYVSIGTAGYKNDVRIEFNHQIDIPITDNKTNEELKKKAVLECCKKAIEWYNILTQR
jgi:hypothetical protein